MVAQLCGLGLTNASELLRRYRSQSLVSRQLRQDVPMGYSYRITETGQARLAYLSSDVMEAGQVIADRAGLSGANKHVFDRWVKQKLGR